MEDEIRMYASSDFDGTPTNVEDKPAQDVELEDEEEEISENSVDTGVDEPSPIAPPERESYAELAPVKAAVKPVVKRARKAPVKRAEPQAATPKAPVVTTPAAAAAAVKAPVVKAVAKKAVAAKKAAPAKKAVAKKAAAKSRRGLFVVL